jgi:hypothetical protein
MAYELQQSSDAAAFQAVYTTAAKQDADGNHYDAAVPMDGSTAYFRLKLVDVDGSFSYSHVLRLTGNCDGAHRITLYPNPATQSFCLSGIDQPVQLAVFDLTGRMVLVHEQVSAEQHISLAQLPAGSYLVRVVTAEMGSHYLRLQKR